MLLAEKGWHQSDLARETGIKHGTINACVNRGSKPKGENLIRLARGLGISPEYLLDDTKDWPPNNGNRQPAHIAEKELEYGTAGGIILPQTPITRIELTGSTIILCPKEGKPITFEKAPGMTIEGEIKIVSE